MPDPTDLSSDIAAQAVEPVSVTADGQSNTGRSISDIIKAQQFLNAAVVMKRRRRGMLTTVLTTPGALDDCGRTTLPPPFGGGIS